MFLNGTHFFFGGGIKQCTIYIYIYTYLPSQKGHQQNCQVHGEVGGMPSTPLRWYKCLKDMQIHVLKRAISSTADVSKIRLENHLGW